MDDPKIERMLANAAERAARSSRPARIVKADLVVRMRRARPVQVSLSDIDERLDRALSKAKRRHD